MYFVIMNMCVMCYYVLPSICIYYSIISIMHVQHYYYHNTTLCIIIITFIAIKCINTVIKVMAYFIMANNAFSKLLLPPPRLTINHFNTATLIKNHAIPLEAYCILFLSSSIWTLCIINITYLWTSVNHEYQYVCVFDFIFTKSPI